MQINFFWHFMLPMRIQIFVKTPWLVKKVWFSFLLTLYWKPEFFLFCSLVNIPAEKINLSRAVCYSFLFFG